MVIFYIYNFVKFKKEKRMSENVKKAYAVVAYEQISDETKLKKYMDIA